MRVHSFLFFESQGLLWVVFVTPSRFVIGVLAQPLACAILSLVLSSLCVARSLSMVFVSLSVPLSDALLQSTPFVVSLSDSLTRPPFSLSRSITLYLALCRH